MSLSDRRKDAYRKGSGPAGLGCRTLDDGGKDKEAVGVCSLDDGMLSYRKACAASVSSLAWTGHSVNS